MTNSLFVLNQQEKIVCVLKNDSQNSKTIPFFDDMCNIDLATGAETYSFSTILADASSEFLIVGNYIAFKEKDDYKLFQITSIEESHSDVSVIDVYCESASLGLINNVFRKASLVSYDFRRFLEAITQDTEWNVGFIDMALNKVLDLEIETASVYSVLQNNSSKYGAELQFRCEINNNRISRKYIDGFFNRGKYSGKRFEFGKNIIGLKRKVDSSELFTALIGEGSNGLSFRDIDMPDLNKPAGQDYVFDRESFERYNHNGYHLMGVFKMETESPEELLRATYQKLQESKTPKITYEVDIALLDNDLGIGDTVNIIDRYFNPPLLLQARVSQLGISITNPQSNKCVLSNFREVRSNINDTLLSDIKDFVNNTVNSKFPVGTDQIQDGAVNGDKIFESSITTDKLHADSITADKIQANSIKTKHLEAGTITADKIQTGTITAESGVIGSLTADVITTGTLNGANVNVTNINASNISTGVLDASHINVTNINATNITTGTLDASKVNVSNLNAGSIVAGTIDASKIQVINLDATNITSGSINADIIEGLIITGDMITAGTIDASKANIINLNADNITSGSISANRLNISDMTNLATLLLDKDVNKVYPINNQDTYISGIFPASDLDSYSEFLFEGYFKVANIETKKNLNAMILVEYTDGTQSYKNIVLAKYSECQDFSLCKTSVGLQLESGKAPTKFWVLLNIWKDNYDDVVNHNWLAKQVVVRRKNAGKLIVDGAITADKIQAGTITGDLISGGTITAGNIASGTITAESGVIGSLNADIITTGTIDASVIGVTNLNASNITTGTLDASKVTVSNINAGSIIGGEIDASKVTVSNLNASNITSGTINGKVVNVTNINATNITSGKLDTSKINVSSTSGNLSIFDNTIKITDNQVKPQTRVQIGEDAVGDYNMYIYNPQGVLMFDAVYGVNENGISNNAVGGDKIKDESITSNKLVIDEIFANKGFISELQAVELRAEQITTGKISGEHIDISGVVSFDSFNADLKENFIFDTTGNKTFINGGQLYTNTVTAEKINAKGLTVLDDMNKTTFHIDNKGEVFVTGTMQSSNYQETGNVGYKISKNGDIVMNNAIVRGDVLLPNAGITNFNANSEINEVRFWAGTGFENRHKAPFRVLQDGSFIASRGEIGGTFTGELHIGNIHISDTNQSTALLQINNNNNTETKIQLTDSSATFNVPTIFSNGSKRAVEIDASSSVVKFNQVRSIFNHDNGYTSFNRNGGVEFTSGEYTHAFTADKGNMYFSNRGKSGVTDFTFDSISGNVKVAVQGELNVDNVIRLGEMKIAKRTGSNAGVDFIL